MSTPPLTQSQQAALTARGNVLVIAGAGTGKTHILVERCCSLLVEENCSLDEILMVTFTEAAAAEMRKRIRARLAGKAAECANTRLAQHLEEQLALLDTASVSTLHSFCLRLVREHFHDERLRLDPEFVVLSEEQVHQLRNNTLDTLLESHYGGDSPAARAFQDFVTEQAGGAESRVRDLIWQLHRYSRSLADPVGWFEKQRAMFANPQPTQWRQWLQAGFKDWRKHWILELKRFSHTSNVADCLIALSAAKENPSPKEISERLPRIQEAHDAKWPLGAIGTVRDKIGDFFSDVEFLSSLLPGANGEDPLAQDWDWSRGHMQTLLSLAREFGELFDEAKREVGGVDFADLEQFALRLLWTTNRVGSQSGGPTPLARELQARLKFVFVDEYQDINEAQDTILCAVSRDAGGAAKSSAAKRRKKPDSDKQMELWDTSGSLDPSPGSTMPASGAGGNRFLVGDVKQSIYRFRLADPKIFQGYKKLWSESPGAGLTVPLSDNFRSREALLDFVNSLFALFMREEIGGVTYDADAYLKFGSPDERGALSRKVDSSPQIEIHLLTKTKDDGAAERNENGRSSADFADLEATEKEARLVALQLKKLRRDKAQIWDNDRAVFRPAEWRDMVVLLRSPRNKAEIFAREFNRAGVPLHVKRESFYGATEVSDLLSLLQLFDNPMQDLPLLAVLRSPIVGLSVDELAMIRAGQHEDRFWTAVLRFCATPPGFSGEAEGIAAAARTKLRAFLISFDLWRRSSQQGALSDCMRRILDETHYESLIPAQDRGEERLANVNRLLRLLRQFDPYQRQGLLRFLRFVEAQRDAEAEEEPASAAIADAVRLFSIHQSKGLEFPIVAIADLNKSFNVSDLHADILFDSEFGLCPRIAPPNVNARYPSLPYWLARKRQKKELLGEELRLLYVAMTRARDRLLLIGSVTQKQFETRWNGDCEISATTLLQARSYADWLAIWFAKNRAVGANGRDRGETRYCRWVVHNDASLFDNANEQAKENAEAIVSLGAADTERLRQKLSAIYAFGAATDEPAKTSVSALRRRATELLEQEETADFFKLRTRRSAKAARSVKSAATVGTVYHRFLEGVSLNRVNEVLELRAEAERMVSAGILSAPEIEWLNFNSLAEFWRSDFGRKILANAQHLRRELAFTARFSPVELAELSPGAKNIHASTLEDEFVIVQGVADIAVILPQEIWLLDFKTDDVAAIELASKVRVYEPQLRLYARALERIYDRPVTECRLHFLTPGVTVPVSRAAVDSARTV